MAKRVQLDITLTLGATDYKDEFSSFTFEVNKEEVDVSVFGNKSRTYELGLANISCSGNLRPEADQALIKYLLQRMEDGADVALVYRPKNAVKGSDNPEVTGNVKISSVPIGGDHGGIESEGTVTMNFNGALTWDDGADTITIG